MFKMTDRELRDLVAVTLMGYLFNEAEGRRPSLDECQALVKWVDAHDFEETLGVVRGEIL